MTVKNTVSLQAMKGVFESTILMKINFTASRGKLRMRCGISYRDALISASKLRIGIGNSNEYRSGILLFEQILTTPPIAVPLSFNINDLVCS